MKTLALDREIRLSSPPSRHLVACETDTFTVWLLIDDKFLHMNNKFVAQLPFDLTFKARHLVYYESMIVVAEESEFCHVFELNEFYNIINHQVFSVREGVINQGSESAKYKGDIIEIFDAVVIDDQVFVLSQLGLTRFDIDDEGAASQFMEQKKLDYHR